MRTHISLPLAASTLVFILGCSGLGIEIPGMEEINGEAAPEEAADDAAAEAEPPSDDAPAEGDAKDTGTKGNGAPEPFSAWTGLPIAGATLSSSGPERVTYEHTVGMPVDMMRTYVEVAVANGWNRPDRRTAIDRTAKSITLDRAADARKLELRWTSPAANGSYSVELEVK
jgi:hypothetical protein